MRSIASCGQKETVIFCDRIMALGFQHAFRAGISFGKDDMVVPSSKQDDDFEDQRTGLSSSSSSTTTASSRRVRSTTRSSMPGPSVPIKISDGHDGSHSSSARSDDRHARQSSDELDLHDEPLRGAWFANPDAPAGRYARPDGQAVRRDHRDADHLELQGRPDRAGVLQLHPRCA